MITYVYECSNCGHTMEKQQSIKDNALKRCPFCKKHKLFRVICTPMYVKVIGEPTTVGQLAERNSKGLSQEQIDIAQMTNRTPKSISRIPQHLLPKASPSPQTKDNPPWMENPRTKKTKDVVRMTPEQVKKYVQTGE